jgi:RNA-directed DNA polymerase
LDADLEKCFDRIEHKALLSKLNTIQPIARLVRAWLKAGIMDQGRLLFPEAGTPQGGVLSPLLANVALHGLENTLTHSVSQRHRPAVIRYADDLVILCADLTILMQLQENAETWLATMGLRFKPSKTRITHTLHPHEGHVGFDFLGFHIQQHRVGQYHTRTYRGQPGFKTLIKPSKEAQKRHLRHIRTIIRQHRGAPQAALVTALNPIIRGWAQYYRSCVAKRVFSQMDAQVFRKLYQWATYRHRRKCGGWRFRRYWRYRDGRWRFSDGTSTLSHHEAVPIVRHAKVKGDKSPFDGDWLYWGQRLGQDPTKPKRVTRLLKRQRGRCARCRLRLTAMDILEVHHQDGNHRNNRYTNLALLHGHCHDEVHGKRCH